MNNKGRKMAFAGGTRRMEKRVDCPNCGATFTVFCRWMELKNDDAELQNARLGYIEMEKRIEEFKRDHRCELVRKISFKVNKLLKK